MLHACAARFDVTGNIKKFAKFFKTKALFSWRKNLGLATVTLSFVFENFYPIKD